MTTFSESEIITLLDKFYKGHGFVGHFEIKFRDEEYGEKSVFGQAVNCLLEAILRNADPEEAEFEAETWRSRLIWHSIK